MRHIVYWKAPQHDSCQRGGDDLCRTRWHVQCCRLDAVEAEGLDYDGVLIAKPVLESPRAVCHYLNIP